MPKISIGLPVYNGERYLQDCIESLLQQEYHDFELIISDNASTDGTAQICEQYVKKDLRISYSRNSSNIGAAPNFHRVFEQSRGTFFKWCASDDICHKSFLRRCIDIFENAPESVVLVYPQCGFIDEYGKSLLKSSDRLRCSVDSAPHRFASVIRNESHGGPIWGLIRSDVLRRTQFMGTVNYGDSLLLAELSLHGKFWDIPEVLFQIRCHSENSFAICGIDQAEVISSHPNQANRKTRKALLLWMDPKQSAKRVWLPIYLERCLEYAKRVRNTPLSLLKRASCYFSIPTMLCRRWCRMHAGELKEKLFYIIIGKTKITNNPAIQLGLRVGELVEVRGKEEILRSLDVQGCMDGMPFMAEMFSFCGKRYRVYKRAHKACDTVFPVRTRRIQNAVHLETRCDGHAHGGCDASCLIYWKEAWLKRVDCIQEVERTTSADFSYLDKKSIAPRCCTEEDVFNAGIHIKGTNEIFCCQATQLPYASENLSPWDLRQYIEDYTSGNIGLGHLIRGTIYSVYSRILNLGIGIGSLMQWAYDRFQGLYGGIPYPYRTGRISTGIKTPDTQLDLQIGEIVRVKSYEEILKTCTIKNKNRGLLFDGEMMPYCGSTYRVKKRVTKILDERTGKMMEMRNPCIILENVFCQARYSKCRLFCPRSIYSFWREIWLERVPENYSSSSDKLAHVALGIADREQ